MLSPFMRWEWMQAWLGVFGGDSAALHIIVCRHGAQVVGIAPFVIMRTARWPLRPRRMRVLRLLGTGEPEAESVVTEYADLLIVPGHEDAVCRAVAERLCSADAKRWDVLACEWLLKGCNVRTHLLPALSARQRHNRERSPGLRFCSRLNGSWDEYLQSISRNIRNKLTVGRRRMERDGRFEILTMNRPEQMAAALERLAGLHRKRWIERGHAGSFESSRFCEFHRRLAATLAASGDATIVIMTLDGKDMAAVYSLHAGDTSFSYQTGFDPALAANYSPGTVVVGVDMQASMARGRRHYDFMCGPVGSYKERYGCETTEMFHSYVFNHSARGYLSLLLWNIADRTSRLRHGEAVAEAEAE